MSINLSPNMNLPVPQVGTEPGPQYATDVNGCMAVIDGHTHEPGYGVQVTPNGLNINSDLTMQGNNLTNARSLRLQNDVTPISGPSDLGALYRAGLDLYYNDGAGTQIRITASGGVAGTPGSISGLTSPASASYVSGSQTFVFQSAVNTPGNIDGASFILRNLVANSFGLTLAPPNSMASDYTITLPVLPVSTQVMTMTSSGVIQNVSFDSSLQISGSVMGLKAHGVAQIDMALRSTGTTVGAGGIAVSASSGAFTTTSNVGTPITNFSLVITSVGRPIMITCQPDGTGIPSYLGTQSPTDGTDATFILKRDGTEIARFRLDAGASGVGTTRIQVPPAAITYTDIVAAGTYTYTIVAGADSNGGTVTVNFVQMVVYET